MSSSAIEFKAVFAQNVVIGEDDLTVELSDGRSLTVPLSWFPRLLHARPAERQSWRLIGGGQGIHWESVDEDISVDGLLAGRPSGESPASLQRWLTRRGESNNDVETTGDNSLA